MNGQGCAILALNLVPINLIFPKNLFYKILLLPFQHSGQMDKIPIFVSHEWFLGHFLILGQKGTSAMILAYNLAFHDNLTPKFIQG